MRIVLTGGGTGGHFFPLIAVAEEIRALARERRLIEPQLFFFAPEPYDAALLAKYAIIFVKIPAGKVRLYADRRNITDFFRTLWGTKKALALLFWYYPDVVFAKGGFGSIPTLLAAHILNIPVVIHESDSVPGRANRLAGRFARRIAVSWRDAAEFFPSEKTAWTGHPVRRALREPVDQTAARAFLKLEPDIPIIFVLGGSQGAQKINELILQTLPQLVERYQIIHQTGVEHLAEMSARADVILSANSHASRYRPFAFLNEHALAMAASVATLAVSRAGSTIFEIAGWGIPSIIIPITESNGDHQRKNAYAYAESGAAAVLEEANLSPTLLLAEIRKIMEDSAHAAAMSAAARTFNNPRAARTIAEKLVEIGLSHES